MYIYSNCIDCPAISPRSQLALKHDGARVVQCLLKYGTEQIRGMVYKELKGEYGRRKDCEEAKEKEENVKKDRSEEDEGRQRERDGEGRRERGKTIN